MCSIILLCYAGATDASPATKEANGYGPGDTKWSVAGELRVNN